MEQVLVISLHRPEPPLPDVGPDTQPPDPWPPDLPEPFDDPEGDPPEHRPPEREPPYHVPPVHAASNPDRGPRRGPGTGVAPKLTLRL